MICSCLPGYKCRECYGLDAKNRSEKTLRDEFAMAALTGILANHARIGGAVYLNIGAGVVTAYEWADAMMAARKTEGGR